MVEAYFLSGVLLLFLLYFQKPLFAGSATDLHLHKYIKVHQVSWERSVTYLWIASFEAVIVENILRNYQNIGVYHLLYQWIMCMYL